MILERFEHGGLTAAMVTPPKSMKPSSSQTGQLPRMRSQDQTVDESNLEQRKRKRRKVKVRNRKRIPTQMAVHVEFPRRSHGKKKGPRNRHPRRRKTKGKRKRTKVIGKEFKACIVGTKGSRLDEIFEKARGYIFSL